MTLSVERLTNIDQLGPFCLRHQDKLECEASGKTVSEVVATCIACSTEAFAVYKRKRLMAIWGFRTSFLGPTTIWLLTTALVDMYPVSFYREGRRLLKILLERFGTIECYVWKPHKRSIAWLKHLGFSMCSVQLLNVEHEFVKMTKGAA